MTPVKTNNNFSFPFMEDKVDIRSIFFILWAEKWLIACIVGFTLCAGIFFAITKIPEYQANILLQVEKNQPGGGLLSQNPMVASLGKSSSPADIQMALIKSRFILEPVVEALGLDIHIQPVYLPIVGSIYSRLHSSQLQRPVFGFKKYAWGGESLQLDHLRVSGKEEGLSYKLIVGENNTYQLFSPAGKFVLQAKIGELAENNNQANPISIRVTSLIANPGTEFLVAKLSTNNIAGRLAQQLQISDLGQVYQMEKTGVLQVSLSGSHPKAVANLLNEIAETIVKKDNERKSVEAAKTLVFLNQQLPIMKAALARAEGALNKHRMQSGTIDLNLKTRMILKQLTDVQREMERANLQRIMLLQKLTPLHPAMISLEGKKKALEEEMISLEKQLQKLPASDQVAVSLLREIKVKSQLYLMLLNKIQELKVIKAGTISDVRILNYANLPNTPLPLGRGIILLGSLLGGLMIGCFIVFIKKAFDRYVDDPNWLEQHFGIPTFAIVPHSQEQKNNMQNYKTKTNKSLILLAQTEPRDLAIEALRSLRTSLQFAMLGAKNNIISIMGISPAAGKSFVSSNFSYILAESGKRVLLIDGDIRKGYLHDYFGAKRAPGLSEAVIGEIDLAAAIQKTPLPQLDFISTGKFPFNPSELLMSENFKTILATVSATYDLVIIDTAPILAVTDGAIIGNHSAVNFLLVSWGKHRAEEIELAMKRLQSNGVKIQGVIVNSTQARNPAQGRYNYSYAYGEN